MKKILYMVGLSLVVLTLLFSVAGCQGEQGPIGPQGDQGIQGATGAVGQQGPRGYAGEDGEDGISITWMGTATSAPKSWRVLNYAYYNSAKGASYIWDGNSWEIWARDGATGATGATGPRGLPGDDAECVGLQAQITALEGQISALEARIADLENPPTLELTYDSGQNDINRAAGHPYIEWTIAGNEITFDFVNPTTWLSCFDYRVDGEPGTRSDWADTIIDEGELAGQEIGPSYNTVTVVAGATETVTVTAYEEVQVGSRLGGEQLCYLDWIIFEVPTVN
ncbi:hypothetical protein ES708_08695 [subsurface metagenome]